MKLALVAHAGGPTRTAARQLLVVLLGVVLAMGVMTLSHPLVAGAADGAAAADATEDASGSEPASDPADGTEPASDPADGTEPATSTPPTDTGGAADAEPLKTGTKSAVSVSAHSPVLLGTADSFAVLGGSTVTNTGPSVISGDLGVAPGCAVTGFPPGTVINGTIYECNAFAAQAKQDLLTAYNAAAGQTPTQQLATQLGGQTLTAGVYDSASGTFQITGILTLDAQGNPDAVFIFQTESTLITASFSQVLLINGAQACNVFWQVGSSATLGTDSSFTGTVMALTSITANTGATVDGSLLALNGAVTLDTNTITTSACAAENGGGENGDGENGGGGPGGGGPGGGGGGGGQGGGGQGGGGQGVGQGVGGENGGGGGANGDGANGDGTNGGGASTVSASASLSGLPFTGLDGRSPVVIAIVMLLVGATLRRGTRRLQRIPR